MHPGEPTPHVCKATARQNNPVQDTQRKVAHFKKDKSRLPTDNIRHSTDNFRHTTGKYGHQTNEVRQHTRLFSLHDWAKCVFTSVLLKAVPASGPEVPTYMISYDILSSIQ